MPENNEAVAHHEKSVGTVVREAREARNLSLEQASRTTRIHVDVLRSLEGDDTAKLGAVYTKGFLKLYADFLGLNKEEIVARFVAATPEAAVVRPRKAASAPQGAAVRLIVESGRRLGMQVQRFFRRLAWRRVALVLLAGVFLFGMGRWIKGCRVRVRERRVRAVALAASDIESAASAGSKPAAAAAKKKDEQKVVLVVRAVEKTWLQVKADGKIIFQGVLAKGSSENWKAKEKIELWIADAGALQLEVNGRFLDRIGRRGQTLKWIEITPKGLAVRG